MNLNDCSLAGSAFGGDKRYLDGADDFSSFL
jgi:hypothetical protein